MVGRAPKKQRTKASDQTLHLQEPRVSPNTILNQSGTESTSSPPPVVNLPVTGHPPLIVNNTMEGGPIFTMGESTAISTDTEIDSYLQTLLSDYPDLPLVSPGAIDGFWPTTENLLLDPRPGISSSEGTSTASGPRPASLPISHTLGLPDKNRQGFPIQQPTADSVRSRLAERIDARVPPSYRDPSVVSDYPHVAALMKIIEYLEEQLQIPRVPIDQAMRLNRQAMAKVREVTDTDEFRRCQSCPLLVATVMDLVVGLYELVILCIQHPAGEGDATSLADHNNPPSRHNPSQKPADPGEMPSDGSSPESAISSGSEPPVFQFGCLEFDPDEQEIFRAAMVRRDLRRCVETIQYCTQEIIQRQSQATNLRGGPLGGVLQSRGPSNNVHTQWYQEMGYRAKDLLAALPAQCSHR